jgi:prophage maintenance system killer protein
MHAQFDNASVKAEYDRWEARLDETDKQDTTDAISVCRVLLAHFLIVDTFVGTNEGIGGSGPRSLDLLHSAVSRQHTSFGTQEKWTDPWEKCATLLFGLIKNHPFHDANKRTALLVALSSLQHRKFATTLPQKVLDRLVVAIAEGKLQPFFDSFPKAQRKLMPTMRGADVDTQILQIAEFLRKNSRRVNNKDPIVTFSSLNQTLRSHGFELKNPYRNYIDIMKFEPQKKGFFGQVISPARQVKIGRGGISFMEGESKPEWHQNSSRNNRPHATEWV